MTRKQYERKTAYEGYAVLYDSVDGDGTFVDVEYTDRNAHTFKGYVGFLRADPDTFRNVRPCRALFIEMTDGEYERLGLEDE